MSEQQSRGVVRQIQKIDTGDTFAIVCIIGIALILGGSAGFLSSGDTSEGAVSGGIFLAGILVLMLGTLFVKMITDCAEVIDENNAERFRRLHEEQENTGE